MIEDLKKLFGEPRLALLAAMPIVKRAGLDAHLQAACNGSATPEQALIIAIQKAGGVPTAEDVARAAKPPQSTVKGQQSTDAGGAESVANEDVPPLEPRPTSKRKG